jgi:uncharacterized protein
MEIQLETQEPHTIRSYNQDSITIQDKTYHQSLCVSAHHIHTPWLVSNTQQLTLADLEPILQYHPEIIIIGRAVAHPPLFYLASELSRQQIGIEWMSIGAACRTFNILLGEHRAVALGILFEGI